MASVRLKPALEERLKRVAQIEGKSVSTVIQEAVEEHCDKALQRTGTLEAALADYIGAFASGGGYDSSRAEEEFGRILEEKKRTGHL